MLQFAKRWGDPGAWFAAMSVLTSTVAEGFSTGARYNCTVVPFAGLGTSKAGAGN